MATAVHHDVRLTQALKKTALDNHVDLIGISDLGVFDDIPASEKPKHMLDSAEAVVVYGVKYKDSICWSRERWVNQMQKLLMHIDKGIAEFLNKKGYRVHSFLTEGNPRHHYEQIKAIYLHPESRGHALISHHAENSLEQTQRRRLYSKLQDAAVSAGLGCHGKNGMIITPEYGPYVYLTMLITDAPLKPDALFDEDLCNNCNLCVDACPTGACTGKGHSHGISKCNPMDCHFTCHRVCYEKIQKEQKR